MVKRKRPSPANDTITHKEALTEQQEVEEQIVRQIGSLELIVNGLENYEPYQKLIEIYKANIAVADDAWHLTPENSQEFRDLKNKKMAAEYVVMEIPTMKLHIQKLQEELVKIQNPDMFVDKDYDER